MYRHKRLLPVLLLALLALPAAAETANDPMRPPGKALTAGAKAGKKAVSERYRLDSIIIGPERRQAIINGRLLGLGESIDGSKLIEVQATQVTLQVAGKPYVLTLLPLSIKMPSEAPRQ